MMVSYPAKPHGCESFSLAGEEGRGESVGTGAIATICR
jgi:hypothetical protein